MKTLNEQDRAPAKLSDEQYKNYLDATIRSNSKWRGPVYNTVPLAASQTTGQFLSTPEPQPEPEKVLDEDKLLIVSQQVFDSVLLGVDYNPTLAKAIEKAEKFDVAYVATVIETAFEDGLLESTHAERLSHNLTEAVQQAGKELFQRVRKLAKKKKAAIRIPATVPCAK